MMGRLWRLLPMWGKAVAVTVLVAVVAAILWRTYNSGYDAAAEHWRSKLADAKAEAVDDYHAALQADRALAERWWEADRKREGEVQTVTREVIKYVESDNAADGRCLDDRMLQLWNSIQRRSLPPGDPTAGGADEGVSGGDAGRGDG